MTPEVAAFIERKRTERPTTPAKVRALSNRLIRAALPQQRPTKSLGGFSIGQRALFPLVARDDMGAADEVATVGTVIAFDVNGRIVVQYGSEYGAWCATLRRDELQPAT